MNEAETIFRSLAHFGEPEVGLYFHTFRDGRVCLQGCITDEVIPGVFTCQLFEWRNGTDSEVVTVLGSDMSEWLFYLTPEDMREAYNYFYRPTFSEAELELRQYIPQPHIQRYEPAVL